MKLFRLAQIIFATMGLALSQHDDSSGLSNTSDFVYALFSVLCGDEATKGENILVRARLEQYILLLLELSERVLISNLNRHTSDLSSIHYPDSSFDQGWCYGSEYEP